MISAYIYEESGDTFMIRWEKEAIVHSILLVNVVQVGKELSFVWFKTSTFNFKTST